MVKFTRILLSCGFCVALCLSFCLSFSLLLLSVSSYDFIPQHKEANLKCLVFASACLMTRFNPLKAAKSSRICKFIKFKKFLHPRACFISRETDEYG